MEKIIYSRLSILVCGYFFVWFFMFALKSFKKYICSKFCINITLYNEIFQALEACK